MEKIDELLIKYFDAVDAGQSVNISRLMKECPEKDRDELLSLIKTHVIIKKSITDYCPKPARKDILKSRIARMQQENIGCTEVTPVRIAARSQELDEAEQKDVQAAFNDIRKRFLKKEE